MAGSWRRAGGAGLLAVVLGSGLGPALADEPLPLQDVDLSDPPLVTLVATVPGMLSGRALPSTAFSAQQGEQVLPLTVTRVVDGPAELVLALDTSDASSLAYEQSAAADLLRSLPPGLPTVVLPTGQRGTAVSALETVAALREGPAELLDGLPAPAQGRRLLVLLGSCDALSGVTGRTAAADEQVSVLATGDCTDEAAELAGEAGVARSGLQGMELLSAVDDVGRALLGQYRLQVDALPDGGPVQLTVRTDDLVASAALPLADSGSGSSSGSGATGTSATGDAGPGDAGPGDALPRTPVVLAALLAAGTGAAVLASLLADRRRARPT